jgi:hypothetical protein
MSVRRWCVLVGLAELCAGIALLRQHAWWPFGVQLGLGGLVLAVAMLTERARYKALDAAPGPGFADTGERSLQNGQWVGAFYNPATGQRRYVVVPPARVQ